MSGLPYLPGDSTAHVRLYGAPEGHPVLLDTAFARAGWVYFTDNRRPCPVLGVLVENPDRDEDTVASGGNFSLTMQAIRDQRDRSVFAFDDRGETKWYQPLARTDTRGAVGSIVQWESENYVLRLLDPDNAVDAALIASARGTTV